MTDKHTHNTDFRKEYSDVLKRLDDEELSNEYERQKRHVLQVEHEIKTRGMDI